MASHSTIYNCENEIIDAKNACIEAHAAVMVELQLNEGTLYPENQSSWQSLYDNAWLLQQALDSMMKSLENHIERH